MKRLGGFALTLALLSLALTLGPATHARASGATSVSGVISTDTTWTAAGGPYLMVGNVGVDTGVTLTIEPGVSVEAQGNYTLQVAGKVDARGTTAAPVSFGCVSNTRSCWGGIQFTSAQSGSIFDHVDIANASTGLDTQTGTWTLTNSRIHDNGDGINAGGSVSPVGVVQHTYIDHNNRGVWVFFRLLQFDHNTVTANATGMSFLGEGDVLHDNNILDNTTWNAYACFYSGSSSVDATGNWWGTTDSTQIAASICDHKDSLNYPTINFDPPATALIDGSPQLLSTMVEGGGGGTVSSTPEGIKCPQTCTSLFDSGTSVTLTAGPDGTSTFTGWSGAGCSGTGTCTVTMSQARSVTATFAQITYQLQISKDGTGAGNVSSSPASIGCGATCSASFDAGTSVTLTATPDDTSTFAGWGGDCAGSSGTCVLTIGAARSVTATFTRFYALTVSEAGTGSGTITSGPSGIACGSACSASFDSGTSVTLTAAPDGTSTFIGWSGAGCSGTGTCTVTMSQARSVTASFTLTYRPDAMIGLTKKGPFAGSGIFNTTGSRQTRSLKQSSGHHVTFFVRLTNQGAASDAMVLLGTGQTRGFATHYFAGTTNITSQVVGGTYSKTLAPGASATIQLVVKVKSTAKIGWTKTWRVLVTSQGDAILRDAAKALVRVVR
jgi:Divergent InlB B-repeat domain/Right handed beta helix region